MACCNFGIFTALYSSSLLQSFVAEPRTGSPVVRNGHHRRPQHADVRRQSTALGMRLAGRQRRRVSYAQWFRSRFQRISPHDRRRPPTQPRFDDIIISPFDNFLTLMTMQLKLKIFLSWPSRKDSLPSWNLSKLAEWKRRFRNSVPTPSSSLPKLLSTVHHI